MSIYETITGDTVDQEKKPWNRKEGIIRQGEVSLVPAEHPNLCGESATSAGAKLAIGETGNAHTLVAQEVCWLHDAIENINEINLHGAGVAREPIFVRVTGGDGVIRHSDRHEGHDEVAVPDGVYRVIIKREQMPFEAEARRVMD